MEKGKRPEKWQKIPFPESYAIWHQILEKKVANKYPSK